MKLEQYPLTEARVESVVNNDGGRRYLMNIRSILRGDFLIPNSNSNIDPSDDSINRWVVWHYKYDPERRERRNQVIACFDNRRAFIRFLERSIADLNVAQLAGRAEKEERITGVIWKAGYKEEIAQRRLFRRGPGQLKTEK